MYRYGVVVRADNLDDHVGVDHLALNLLLGLGQLLCVDNGDGEYLGLGERSAVRLSCTNAQAQ